MRVSLRPLSLALLFASSVALAASGRVTLQYQGQLGDALRKIATESGINLVVTGNFQQPVQLTFNDLPADQALEIIARTNHLQLTHEGSVYTLSPAEPAPAAPQVSPAPAKPANANDQDQDADEDKDDSDEAAQTNTVTPPMPPLPPMPRGPFGHLGRAGHSDHDFVGTGSVTIAKGQTVDDAVTYGGTLTVNGTVQGDAVAFGGNVHLGPNARVKGDAVAFGGSVVREDGAEVGGQQMSFGGKHVGTAIAEGLSQSVAHVEPEVTHSHLHPMSSLAWFLMEFVLCFGMGFLFLMFFPSPMKQIEGELNRDLLRCGATGVLGSLALILLSGLLAITVIGIPVVLVLWIAIVVGLCMGYTALANEIGMRLPLLRGKKTQASVLAVGTVVLLFISRIPFAGPGLLALIGLVGLGAIIRTRFGTRNRSFPEPV